MPSGAQEQEGFAKEALSRRLKRQSIRRLVAFLVLPLAAITIISGVYLFKQLRAEEQKPRSAVDLVKFCTASGAAASQYCNGYVESVELFFRVAAACSIQSHNSQSFCAGARAADEAFSDALMTCSDCSFDTFEPQEPDIQARGRRFAERMAKFASQLEGAVKTCAEDANHDRYYCEGYNSERRAKIADFIVTQGGEQNISSQTPETLGLGEGESDVGLHLFASAELYHMGPCLAAPLSTQKAKDIVLDFARKHPEQVRETSAVLLIGRALTYSYCGDKVQPHMEMCTKWRYYDGALGTENACATAVMVSFLFVSKTEGKVIQRELKPGEVLRSGLSQEKVASGWYMFTTCPVGYFSSVPLKEEYREAIRDRQYDCVKK